MSRNAAVTVLPARSSCSAPPPRSKPAPPPYSPRPVHCSALFIQVFSSAAKMIEADYPTGMINYDNKARSFLRAYNAALCFEAARAICHHRAPPWRTLSTLLCRTAVDVAGPFLDSSRPVSPPP